MLKITAIGAHPDDIEIFFYGTLAACRDRGDAISLLLPLMVLPAAMTRAQPSPPAALVKRNAVLPGWARRSC